MRSTVIVLGLLLGLDGCAPLQYQPAFREYSARRLTVTVGSPATTQGTGVIVGQDAGAYYVLTASHVVGSEATVPVASSLCGSDAGRPVPASGTLGPTFDLTLLKVKKHGDCRFYTKVLRLQEPMSGERLNIVGESQVVANTDPPRVVTFLGSAGIGKESYETVPAGGNAPLGPRVSRTGTDPALAASPTTGDSGAGAFDADWRLTGVHLRREGPQFGMALLKDVVPLFEGIRQKTPDAFEWNLQEAPYARNATLWYAAGSVLTLGGLGVGFWAYHERLDYYSDPTRPRGRTGVLNIVADTFIGSGLAVLIGRFIFDAHSHLLAASFASGMPR